MQFNMRIETVKKCKVCGSSNLLTEISRLLSNFLTIRCLDCHQYFLRIEIGKMSEYYYESDNWNEVKVIKNSKESNNSVVKGE